jgi:hypothetical protein
MKKLIVLILLLLTSLSSFSQTDTTKVRISTPIAKLVIKDIIKGDGCIIELKLTQEKLFKTEEREKEKDSHIFLLEDKDKNNNFMMVKKDVQLKTSYELSDNLRKELKEQRTKIFFWKVGAYVGIITSTYLLLLK